METAEAAYMNLEAIQPASAYGIWTPAFAGAIGRLESDAP